MVFCSFHAFIEHIFKKKWMEFRGIFKLSTWKWLSSWTGCFLSCVWIEDNSSWKVKTSVKLKYYIPLTFEQWLKRNKKKKFPRAILTRVSYCPFPFLYFVVIHNCHEMLSKRYITLKFIQFSTSYMSQLKRGKTPCF